jgi:hypothetical protein
MIDIDALCERAGFDPKEFRQTVIYVSVFVLSLIVALSFIAGWVALTIYVIVPLRLDASMGIGFLRGFLAVGGAFLIGTAYLLGLYGIISQP